MPKSGVADADHVVFTDHSIPRRPRSATKRPLLDRGELALFGGGRIIAREQAMAYALAGQKFNNATWQSRAFDLLRALIQDNSTDVELMEQLAVLYEARGRAAQAAALYQRVLRLDPARLTSLVNLGAIHLRAGQPEQAVARWTDALQRNPGLLLVRSNLAVALQQLGRREEARAVLQESLVLNPVFSSARDQLERLK